MLRSFFAVPCLAAGLAALKELTDSGWLEGAADACEPRGRDVAAAWVVGAASDQALGPLPRRTSAMLARWSSHQCRHFFGPPDGAQQELVGSAYVARMHLWLPASETEGDLQWPHAAMAPMRHLTYEDVAVPLAYDPCQPSQLNVPRCAVTAMSWAWRRWRRFHGPWDAWCMPYFVRTPVRSVKVATAFTPQGQRLTFVMNWKAASSTLRVLLQQAPFHSYVDPHAIRRDGCTAGLGECCKHASTSSGNLSASRMVAFVRDPLDRFLAGVYETGQWYGNMGRNLIEVRREARRLLDFPHQQRLCKYSSQSYLLSGTDAKGVPLEPSFLGRVEDFDADWRALGAWLGMNLTSAGFDTSSKVAINPSGSSAMKSRIRAAVMSDEKVVCSVCAVFLQDYACFGYLVPEPCCRGHCSRHGIHIPVERLLAAGCAELPNTAAA